MTNTGKVAGKEIVQLYVRDVQSTFARPEKELKAFEKIELKPKQKKTVTFTLDREAFWYFDVVKNSWNTETGEFEILVGASSRDIRLSEKLCSIPKQPGRLHTGLAFEPYWTIKQVMLSSPVTLVICLIAPCLKWEWKCLSIKYQILCQTC